MPGTARRGITAMDVARLAGVSQSAVSRSFTPGASVAPATRARVLAAAAELGYRPNLIARSLITRRSGMIGVAIGNLRNQLYPVMLERLAEGLSALGFRILLFNAPLDGDADPEMAQIMRYQVDGVVLAATAISSALARECRAAGVPVILFNRTIPDASGHGVSSVTGSNREGGRAIAELLAGAGHRRPAFIAGLDHASTSIDREQGFAEGLHSAGLPAAIRVSGRFNELATVAAMTELLSRPTRPDAVFAASDQMAIVAMDVARSRFGLRVPEDISIVGFDDAPPAAWPAYDLTTYAQPIGPMVDATIRLLIDQIDQADATSSHVVVPGGLILRGSSRLPPGLRSSSGVSPMTS